MSDAMDVIKTPGVEAMERAARRSRMPESAAAYQPRSFAEAREMAEFMAKSELIPAAYRGKPSDIIVAAAMGASLGMTMATALQSIYVIQGRPSLYVEAAIAVVRASGQLVSLAVQGDETQATATATRQGGETMTTTFTMTQAQRMNLTRNPSWTSQGAWMLETRAIGRVLHRLFPDILRGLGLVDPAGRPVEQDDMASAEPEATAPKPVTGNGGKLRELTERLTRAAERPPEPPAPEPEPDPPHPQQGAPAPPADSVLERSLLLSTIGAIRTKHAVSDAVFARMAQQVGLTVGELGRADVVALGALLELLGHRREPGGPVERRKMSNRAEPA
jgi:hypothetical protein